MTRAFASLLLFFTTISLSAQSPISYQLEIEKGFIIIHSQDIAPIGQSYPFALGFSAQKWLLADKHWKNCHCYPRLGWSLAVHDFDNPDVLGWGFPLYGFLEPWYKINDGFFLNIRAAVGLVYLSKPYDEQSNPLNVSYSMPVQAYLSLGGGLAYSLDDQWRVGLQARYDHTSNGGLREPNKGINYPTLNLSIDYSPDPIQLKAKSKEAYNPAQKQRRLRLGGFLAGKASGFVGEGVNEQQLTYLVSGLSALYTQQFSRSSAFIVGGEWINNLAYRKEMERAGLTNDHNQIGLLFGHEFLLGKFSFSQAMGLYLYKDYGASADVYQRYSLLYRPIPGLAIGPGLKAHANVAEFVDFSLVWDFHL